MTDIDPAAIEAAAKAAYAELVRALRVQGDDGTFIPWDDISVQAKSDWLKDAHTHLTAAAPLIERAVLTAASQALWDWAEDMGDVGSTGPRAARKRVIKACARKVAPEPTEEEMRTALADLLGGMSRGVVCNLDAAGKSIPPAIAQDDGETQMARKPAESALGATDGADEWTGEGGGSR